LTVLLLLELINVVILAIILLSSSCFDASGVAVRASATTKANVAAVARFVLFFLWVAALAAVLIFFACGVSFANSLASSLMTDQLNFEVSAATQYLSPICLFVGLSLKLGLAPAQFVIILLYRTFTVSTLFNYLVFYYVYSIWVGAWLFVYAFGLSGALGVFFLIGTLVVWVLLSTVELSEDTRQMLALSTLVNFIVLYSAIFLCFTMMFLKAAKSVGMAFATVPLAGCAVGLGLVFGAFLRGTSYSPDMEDTLFSHAMLGFALIETFMVVALGLVGLIYAL
jgi:F0F1-type ATP synthase membrane subunit c/vacuolar-type H+-ATPase subunit K